jgi:hypothetical protein
MRTFAVSCSVILIVSVSTSYLTAVWRAIETDDTERLTGLAFVGATVAVALIAVLLIGGIVYAGSKLAGIATTLDDVTQPRGYAGEPTADLDDIEREIHQMYNNLANHLVQIVGQMPNRGFYSALNARIDDFGRRIEEQLRAIDTHAAASALFLDEIAEALADEPEAPKPPAVDRPDDI